MAGRRAGYGGCDESPLTMCAERVRGQDDDRHPGRHSSQDDVRGREDSHLHGDRTGSALSGKLDYADLAERVIQGVSVTLEEKKNTQE